MRSYTIKGIEHIVYESQDETPADLVYLDDWRRAKVGDWVLSDDGCILQILRKNPLRNRHMRNKIEFAVGTCTGTFIDRKASYMDTEKRKDIYRLSPKYRDDLLKTRENITAREIVFAKYVTSGMELADAYLKAFRTKRRNFAHAQGLILIKTERIQRVMKEELKPVMEALGIDPELVLAGIRDIATDEEAKDSDKLKALFELGEILELKEPKKTTEFTAGALFQGFQPDQLESVDRPKLKEAKNA